jgi:hypothetical protein
MAETYNRRIRISVTGTIFIDFRLIFSIDVIRNRIGVGTQLDRTERNAGAGKSMSHSIGTYERVDIAAVLLLLSESTTTQTYHDEKMQKSDIHMIIVFTLNSTPFLHMRRYVKITRKMLNRYL